jgi:hypothetical protein
VVSWRGGGAVISTSETSGAVASWASFTAAAAMSSGSNSVASACGMTA